VRTAIIGSEPPARAYRDALADFPELVLHPADSVQDLLKGKTVPDVALLCTPPIHRLQEIQPLVLEGRAYKDAVSEIFAINAQLLALWRRQNQKKKRGG